MRIILSNLGELDDSRQVVRELVGVVVLWGTHRVGQLESLSLGCSSINTALHLAAFELEF